MNLLHPTCAQSPPVTPREIADSAMTQAANPGNRMHAQDLIARATTRDRKPTPPPPEDTRESEGGHFAPDPTSPNRSGRPADD
jgi:hypothetical protein